MGTAIVSLDGVDVSLRGRRILSGLDWRLRGGQHWSVIGPNGSGKTSFLKLVAGEYWPCPKTAGIRLYDFGEGTQTDAIQARQRISLVGPELQDLYYRRGWNLTGAQVVATGFHRTEIPRFRLARQQRGRLQEIMGELGIEELSPKRYFEMSRGEQRKCLIGRALAGRCDVLVLDEIVEGLDGAARSRLIGLLEGTVSRGVQVLYSAHHVEGLPGMLTHVLHLEDGHISLAGPRRSQTVEPGGEPHAGVSTADESYGAPPLAAMQAEPLIELRKVDVYIGRRKILRDLQWRLEEGRHWLITGANGAGKSTFLRLLHAQHRPALGGRACYGGFGPNASVWDIRRRVGWVSPELQAKYRYHATVEECVQSGIESSIGLVGEADPGGRERARAWLTRLGLGHLAGRPVSRLSYGQFRLALVARAMVNDPSVLLLDEPAGGLDKTSRHRLQTCLEMLAADGASLVCASHEHDYLAGLWSDQGVFDRGKLEITTRYRGP